MMYIEFGHYHPVQLILMTFPSLGTRINRQLVDYVANAHWNGFDCANDCDECVLMALVHWYQAFPHSLLLHRVFVGPF